MLNRFVKPTVSRCAQRQGPVQGHPVAARGETPAVGRYAG
jgi:hypothetical protein